jgi:type VI secretion system protein VasI
MQHIRRIAAMALVAAALAVPSAQAADLASSVRACRGIADDGARLSCYDALSGPEDLPSASAEPSAGHWMHVVEKDPMTDFENSSWTVVADNEIPDQLGRGIRPRLTIRCQNGGTELYVDWRRFITTDGPRGGVDITYRVDQQPANKTVWSMSTNNEGTFSKNAVTSARVMKGGRSLLISTVPYNDNAVTASFDITGINDAIMDVAHRCGWPY